ncbi:hypothetical protein AXX12_06455 [Anaerosporomusa subterranea]|uniref:histidine kinase n=1 Tax=Anaerosporomusa subterranea TaxID=1794912 RepID=A0A154BQ61_ANASB|nr:ATP-binding protein [Anaerosporomusa subterranea]KYZ76082.1 hypothetical protein AXX12_06455 [Anaerosporomusa subterranea]
MRSTTNNQYIQPGNSKLSGKRAAGFCHSHRLDAVEQIAAGLAYGIRNPLTVIKGYLQVYQRNPAYCTREALNLMLREVEDIEAITSSLISLVRNTTTEKSPQDLNQILSKLFPVIQAEAIQHGVAAELYLSDRLPLLAANREEMQQLIINLARNSLEAMSGSGRLAIGTSSKENKVVLFVRDEGSGIPPEQIKKIFTPFYTTKSGNAGLGLTVGLSIIKRHQGRMQITSTIGAGTTVRAVFPVWQQRKESYNGE